jgi:hypothetical protein
MAPIMLFQTHSTTPPEKFPLTEVDDRLNTHPHPDLLPGFNVIKLFSFVADNEVK